VGVLGAAPRGGGNGEERGGPGFGDVDRHDIDAAAPGHSNSRGRHTPHGRSRHAAIRGGWRGTSDVGVTADKWGWAVAGPGGQRWGAGEMRESG
jgi:hypothetical protein